MNSEGGVPIWDLGTPTYVVLGLLVIMLVVVLLAFTAGKNK
jgi:hypothetical protein